MNKERLTETEIEDIKKTVRKQTKTENPKPEDVAVRLENLKVQSCKLYNNKYMVASTEITNTEIFAFIAVLVIEP